VSRKEKRVSKGNKGSDLSSSSKKKHTMEVPIPPLKVGRIFIDTTYLLKVSVD